MESSLWPTDTVPLWGDYGISFSLFIEDKLYFEDVQVPFLSIWIMSGLWAHGCGVVRQ